MNSQEIERRLHKLGQGATVSCWNGTFDVQKLDSPEVGQRRVLASGRHIDAALFDRADARVEEIKRITA